MLNSIRLYPLASLLGHREAEDRMPTREGQGDSGDLCCVETVSAAWGVDGVIGDGMAGSWSDVNQGSGAGQRTAFMAGSGSKNRFPEADRASVGAKKRGNSRGAKGGKRK
jgi:hypothetical protein